MGGRSPDHSNYRGFTNQMSLTSWRTTCNCSDPTVAPQSSFRGGAGLKWTYSPSPEPQTSLLVLLDRSPIGGGLQYPVPVMDRAVSLIPLLERTLIKIIEDKEKEVMVVTPSWPRRSWYHVLLQIVCEIPLRLPVWGNFLSHLPKKGVLYHTDVSTLQLTTYKLSGVPSRARAFLMQLSE